MVQASLALRVDVDTRRGLEEGVPRLLEILRARGLRASFFVTMGPDRSGLAIRRAWRPSFLAKMWRTGAVSLYGFRTLLSGTVLAARPVGGGCPALLRRIADQGHEVAMHGFDHVGWQDRVHRLRPEAIARDLHRARAAFHEALGVAPRAAAAPGWRTTPAALTVQEDLGLAYASDVRGDRPFRPLTAGGPLGTIQIPTTLATMDEMLGRERDLAAALGAALRPTLNVFTLHAEVEGGPLAPAFAAFLDLAARRGVCTVTLGEVAERIRREGPGLPTLPVGRGRVPGRSGWVAVAEAA